MFTLVSSGVSSPAVEAQAYDVLVPVRPIPMTARQQLLLEFEHCQTLELTRFSSNRLYLNSGDAFRLVLPLLPIPLITVDPRVMVTVRATATLPALPLLDARTGSGITKGD